MSAVQGKPKGYEAKKCGNIGYKEWHRQMDMGISQPHARNCAISSRSSAGSPSDFKVPSGMNAEDQLNFKLTHAKQQQGGVKTKLKQALIKQAELASELEAKKTLIDSSKNSTALNNVCYNGKGAGVALPAHSAMNTSERPVVARGVKHHTLRGDVEGLEELARMITVESLPFARTIRVADTLKITIANHEMRVSTLTRDIHSMEDQLVSMKRRHEEKADNKLKREREDNEEATDGYSNTGDTPPPLKRPAEEEPHRRSSVSSSGGGSSISSPFARDLPETQHFGEEDDSDVDDELAM